MSIGSRLREERAAVGVSQAALAAACDVRRQSQVEFEQDMHLPGSAYLVAAARQGVDVKYVLTGHRGIEKVAEPFDEALLGDVIEGVEHFLLSAKRSLTPRKKAALIILVYEEFRARGRAKRADVLEFLHAA